MFFSYLDIRNNFWSIRKTNINIMFSPTLMPKWSKFLMTCKLETCDVFFLFCLQWYTVVSFCLLFNNQISRAGNYYPFILELIVTDLFTQRVKKRKKKINPNPQTSVFILKKNKLFFFFFLERDRKKRKKRKKETIANKCFVIHNCMLFIVMVVIIQLYVVSPVSSCLCILWVSFCLFLLWLF